jgi:hypothetical protein
VHRRQAPLHRGGQPPSEFLVGKRILGAGDTPGPGKNMTGGLKKVFFSGWSKTSRCKAREILRNEAYIPVRRNDEG